MASLGVRKITLTDEAADQLLSTSKGFYNPNLPEPEFMANQVGRLFGMDIFREGLTAKESVLEYCSQCESRHTPEFGREFHDRVVSPK
jgi:hypothetical protein